MNKNNIPALPFYFIRHGETDWNLEHKIMGNTDVELNSTGIDQSYRSAYVLANIEISKVYCSSLQRAYQTGKIISAVCEIEIEAMNQLKERSWGSLEGKDYNNNISCLSNDNLPNDGEEYINFENRIIEGTRKVLLSNYGYPIIVSHSGVFKVLAKLLADNYDIRCPNCKIFFFSPPALDNKWDITPVEVE